jgi:hypothetical protein
MLYIQQSLNPDEEIVRVGHFHWWYTFGAAMWLVFGTLAMVGILYGGYYYEVNEFMKANFAGVPDNLKSMAWDESVKALGGFQAAFTSSHLVVKLVAFGVFIIGLLFFVQKMVIKATTEICLTSERLVLKRGLISRFVEEISVDRIEGVDVFQGILGRMLGFGRVSARGMGVGEVNLPLIEEPVEFRKAIDRARNIRRNKQDF